MSIFFLKGKIFIIGQEYGDIFPLEWQVETLHFLNSDLSFSLLQSQWS